MGVELTDEELQQAFSGFDKDGSGLIQASQFMDLMKACGVDDQTPFEAKLLFNLCDCDASGVLTFGEFKMMFIKQCEWTPEEELKAIFRTVDEDGSGSLSKDEMEKMLTNIMRETGEIFEEGTVDAMNFFDHVFLEVDLDGDGRINYEEFVKTMKDSGEFFS